MAFHPTYSSRRVVINYAGVNLSDGKAEDAFLTIAHNTPRASYRKGADGNTSAALSSDMSLTVTISMFPESSAAKALGIAYYGLREAERQGAGVLGAVPLGIVDEAGTTILTTTEAVLTNVGDLSLGQDTGTIDFEFYVENAILSPAPAEVADLAASALDALSVSVDVGL